MFPDKHSIDVDRDGFVWITDRTDQMVYKFTMDGRLLLTVGKKGVTGDNKSTDSFDRPSDVIVAPNGGISSSPTAMAILALSIFRRTESSSKSSAAQKVLARASSISRME